MGAIFSEILQHIDGPYTVYTVCIEQYKIRL